MVAGNLNDLPFELIGKVGEIGLYLQALGFIIVLWIIFQLILLYFNRKRMLEVYKIKQDMKRIEEKIDRILNKR